MRARGWPLLLVTGAIGCGSAAGTMSTAAHDASAPATATRTAAVSIVGTWRTHRTCQGLLQALRRAHLRPVAAAVVGDYFPGQSPRQLARKRDLCRGARPQLHSHFFTPDGRFGSLDEHGQQVDDGRYRAGDAGTIHIGNADTGATFHYHIVHGRSLTLVPVITTRMRRRALAHPFRFSPAGWAVAVAYTGHTWTRVRSARG
jgi:hypothetical protein